MLSGNNNNKPYTQNDEIFISRCNLVKNKIKNLPPAAKYFFQDKENLDVLVACFSDDVEYFKAHVDKRHYHQQLLVIAIFADCANVANYLFKTMCNHQQLPLKNPTASNTLNKYFEIIIRSGNMNTVNSFFDEFKEFPIEREHCELAKELGHDSLYQYFSERVVQRFIDPNFLAIGEMILKFLKDHPHESEQKPYLSFFIPSMSDVTNGLIANGNLKKLKDILELNPDLRSTINSDSLTSAIKSGSHQMVEYLLDPRNEFNIKIEEIKHPYDARDADPFDALPILIYTSQKCREVMSCFESKNFLDYRHTITKHLQRAAEFSLDAVHRTIDFLARKYANDHGKIFYLSSLEYAKTTPYPALKEAVANKDKRIQEDLEIVSNIQKKL